MLKYLQSRAVIVAALVALVAGASGNAQVPTDDFSTSANWTSSSTFLGNGMFDISSGRANYTVSDRSANDLAFIRYTPAVGSYTSDWSVQVDLYFASPSAIFNAAQTIDAVLNVVKTGSTLGFNESGSPRYHSYGATVALSRTTAVEPSFQRWFRAGYSVAGDDWHDSAHLAEGSVSAATATVGTLRVSFDSTTKVLSAAYDVNGPTGGYSFTDAGFSVDTDAPATNWNMLSGDSFSVYLFGNSLFDGFGENGLGPVVTAGEVSFANFQATNLTAVPEPSTPAGETVSDDLGSTANWAPARGWEEGFIITGGSARYNIASRMENSAVLAWRSSVGAYTSDWSVQVDVHMDAADSGLVANDDYVFASLEVARFGDNPIAFGPNDDELLFRAFTADMVRKGPAGRPSAESRNFVTSSHAVPGVAPGAVGGAEVTALSTDVSLRIAFDSAAKTLTSYYDANGPTGGYVWTALRTVVVDATSTHWEMTATDTFLPHLKIDSRAIVSGAAVTFDNFSATGLRPLAGRSSLVGAWQHGDGRVDASAVLIFLSNGYVLYAEDNDNDGDNNLDIDGIERGTYTWNPVTGAAIATALVDTNGNLGLSHYNLYSTSDVVLAQGDVLTTFDFEGAVFRKVGSSTNPIVGTWISGDATQADSVSSLTFLPNGRYMMLQDGPAGDPNGRDGLELGAYTWDAATGAVTMAANTDTNGAWGFNGTTLASGVKITVDGNTLALVTPAQGTSLYQRVTDSPVVSQPTHQSAAAGAAVTLDITGLAAAGAALQWQHNGSNLSGATNTSLAIANVQPVNTGVYRAIVSHAAGNFSSDPAIVGITGTSKVIGMGSEVGADIVHANGNVFDQILLEGKAATVMADSAKNEILRMSYLDMNDDIVQVEFAGAGTLSLVLDGESGPVPPVKYNQSGIGYMKGHAGIVITGANETTHLSVFSVGRGTAVNQALFKDEVTYDGRADIAFVAIASSNGKFGGLRTANAHYFATKGVTGVYAPGVDFQGPVFVHNIDAWDTATPMLVIGSSADTRITGGSLFQTNGQPVRVAGLTQLKFTGGSTSHEGAITAKVNEARLEENGVDVTAQLVVNPSP